MHHPAQITIYVTRDTHHHTQEFQHPFYIPGGIQHILLLLICLIDPFLFQTCFLPSLEHPNPFERSMMPIPGKHVTFDHASSWLRSMRTKGEMEGAAALAPYSNAWVAPWLMYTVWLAVKMEPTKSKLILTCIKRKASASLLLCSGLNNYATRHFQLIRGMRVAYLEQTMAMIIMMSMVLTTGACSTWHLMDSAKYYHKY